jgi:two-component system copper resistance phosphate regulon response regulator CusR
LLANEVPFPFRIAPESAHEPVDQRVLALTSTLDARRMKGGIHILWRTIAMRILVVEDDAPLASFLSKGLEAEHYAVDIASDGEDARWLASENDFDLMILDLNLPKMDGIAVLQAVRPQKPSLPVLVLTGRSRLEDRVQSLDCGADDCLLKPFSFTELSARVRALLRRHPFTTETVLKIADLELNRIERTVRRAGKRIELTSKEFGLLEYLFRNAGHRITRSMIVEHVWNLSFDTGTNIVDVYINYLRNKIDDGFSPKLIHTVRGVGYELRCPVAVAA